MFTMPAAVTAANVSDDPQKYEIEHVHSVYEEIAPHFSSTRYKPWPIIAQFLASLPAGWVGLDSGTGNGKYLPLPLDRPGDVWTIGLDRSRNLLEIAQSAGAKRREVVWGDVLDRPWRPGVFDYAISIATIHHLSTHERRREAIQRLLECISPLHGRALIYVWAIEQDDLSKRSIPSAQPKAAISVQEDISPAGQDVFVPWVLSAQKSLKSNGARESSASPRQSPQEDDVEGTQEAKSKVFNRYYHMFAKGELPTLVSAAARGLGLDVGDPDDINQGRGTRGIQIVQDGWERSNYYIELRRWEK